MRSSWTFSGRSPRGATVPTDGQPPRPPAVIQYATTVSELDEVAAQLLRYRFVTEHVCMECGVRVGGQSLVKHAMEHAGIPIPEKPKKQPAQPGASS
jgi:hypothetical protein